MYLFQPLFTRCLKIHGLSLSPRASDRVVVRDVCRRSRRFIVRHQFRDDAGVCNFEAHLGGSKSSCPLRIYHRWWFHKLERYRIKLERLFVGFRICQRMGSLPFQIMAATTDHAGDEKCRIIGTTTFSRCRQLPSGDRVVKELVGDFG